MLASIENHYERLVMECIQEILSDSDQITDTDYVDDLACVALNQLPPRYVRHSIDLASHLSDAEQEDLRRQAADAVRQGIEIIARRRTAR